VTPGTVDGLAITDLSLTTTAAKVQIWGAFPPAIYNNSRRNGGDGRGEHQPVRLPAELMTAIADQDGKVWIAVDRGDACSATFAIAGDGGVPFAPGQEVTIDDARLASVIDQSARAVRTESGAITESA
jgi:hypothetical protein